MKLALLLPGYLDSPDYLRFLTIERSLHDLGYLVERLDACGLWATGDVGRYNLTNYLKDIRDKIDSYRSQNPDEIILIGHSLGAAVAVIAAEKYPEISQVVALCPAVAFGKSANKWQNGLRYSRRELPGQPTKFREFNVPATYIEDIKKYSLSDSLRKLKKPLMVLIALKDKIISPKAIETAVEPIHPYIVRLKNADHFFRTETEATRVADEIVKFLSKN